jgi:exonuclease SbcD
MRILHTSDWHVGRHLGRHDRTTEFRAVLDEVVAIADARAVDLVLVSGDVFDRPIPSVDALTLGLEGLLRLAEGRPVVAVAGNHDSPELFDALAPLLEGQGHGVHLVGSIRRPQDGGIIACLPFLREGRVVDFMRDAGEWYGAYAARIAALTAVYDRALADRSRSDVVPLLMAHFMVGGVKVDRGAPRGERELHMGEAYTATAQAIPPGPQYVALGHIHAPQAVPGSPVPAQYAGSLLPLDFGEAGEQKRVVLVEVEPGSLASVTSIPLTSGRPLVRAAGTWDELEARADALRDSYLDLAVQTTATDGTLAQRARDTFPFLVKVRALRSDVQPRDRLVKGHHSWAELYVDYFRAEHAEEPPDDLLALLRDVLEEAADAPA